MTRRRRKARAKRSVVVGFTIQFIPGGFYHLRAGKLYTGIKIKLASDGMQAKLMPLAEKAIEKPGEWVTL